MNTGKRPLKASGARRAAWRRLCRPAGAARVFEEPQASPGPQLQRRDRAQADRMVRGVLRHLRMIDALLRRPNLFNPGHTPPPLLWVLRLAAYEKIFQAQSPDYAIGQQATALGREGGGARGARFINAVIRRLLPSLPDSPEALRQDALFLKSSPAVRWSVPEDIAQALGKGYGPEAIESVLEALAEGESPTWLRVNRLRTNPEMLTAKLEFEGVEISPQTPVTHELGALCVIGGEKLPWATQAWREGECTVQDIGAMLAAQLLAPAPGMAVLDACAAPGGKTGHLWELMEGRGRLVAAEIHPDRRRELAQAIQRLYGPDHGIEFAEVDNLAKLESAGSFDRVLVDSPCQALGLIRRHPEIRWDDRLKRQGAMVAIQRQVLDEAARQVAPGGRLLWVTCSPTPAENEQVVTAWLEQNESWETLEIKELVPESWLPFVQCKGPFLRTRPDQLACDGFAMCMLAPR